METLSASVMPHPALPRGKKRVAPKFAFLTDRAAARRQGIGIAT